MLWDQESAQSLKYPNSAGSAEVAVMITIVVVRTDIFHLFQIIIIFSQGGKVSLNFIENLHHTPPPTRILFTLHIVQSSSWQCHFFYGCFTNGTWEFLSKTSTGTTKIVAKNLRQCLPKEEDSTDTASADWHPYSLVAGLVLDLCKSCNCSQSSMVERDGT